MSGGSGDCVRTATRGQGRRSSLDRLRGRGCSWLRWQGDAVGRATAEVVSNAAFAAFGLLAVVCAVMAAAANGGRSRAAWACVAFGVASWVAAGVARSLHPLWSGTAALVPVGSRRRIHGASGRGLHCAVTAARRVLAAVCGAVVDGRPDRRGFPLPHRVDRNPARVVHRWTSPARPCSPSRSPTRSSTS